MSHTNDTKTTRQTSGPITLKKPRSDSPLRMLSWERQKQIVASLQTASQKQVAAEILETDNLTVDAPTLTRFSQWHVKRSRDLGEQVHEQIEQLNGLAETLQEPTPRIDSAQVLSLAKQLILVRAFKALDAAELSRIQRLQQADKSLELRERRVALGERQEQIELLRAEAQMRRDAARARELCSQLPGWCEAEAKKSEPKVTTIEEVEASVRKSFGLRSKPQAPQPGRAAAPSAAAQPTSPQPAQTKSSNGHGPSNPPLPSGPDTQHETPNTTAASVPVTTDPAPSGRQMTTDKTPHSPLPPEPPYWHPPANQAPVNLPEERMCIAELLNVPLPGDKYLRMGHVGLDLASKTKAFYPRLLCKVEFLTPEFVREMMNDIRRGAL